MRGLGTVVRHRLDDLKSAHYEALLEAEQNGIKNKKNMHSSKEAPVHRVNDVSLRASSARQAQLSQ